jgi:hypothetical protein
MPLSSKKKEIRKVWSRIRTRVSKTDPDPGVKFLWGFGPDPKHCRTVILKN